MRARFGVVADDLTGASDVGVQFKKCGMETIVLTDMRNLASAANLAEVLVIDTESRNDLSRLACEKVKEVAGALKTAQIKVVYKKIDSTLRGNIGFELDALIDVLDVRLSILAPAFPATRRTTVGGCQLLNRVPLEETEFAHNPISRVEESHIPTLIRRQSRHAVGHVNLSTVRAGSEQLRQEIRCQQKMMRKIIVVDAVTQNDLRVIAQVIIDLDALGCGSAGLAEELAKALKNHERGSVVVISGSASKVTMKQISRAKRISRIRIVELDVHAILNGGKPKEEELRKVVGAVREATAISKDVIIRSAKSEEQVDADFQVGVQLGLTNTEVGETISLFLADVFDLVVENCTFAGLILIGGDTGIRIVRALRAFGMRIEDEVSPGIPVSKLIGGKYNGLRIVTKAGGFGDENAVVDSIRHLKRDG